MEERSYIQWKDHTTEQWQRMITSPRLPHRPVWAWAVFTEPDGDSFDIRTHLWNTDDERRVKEMVDRALRRRLHSALPPETGVVGLFLHAMADGEQWRLCVNNAPGDAPQSVPRLPRAEFVARVLTNLTGTPLRAVMPLARYSVRVRSDGELSDTFDVLDPLGSAPALGVALADRLSKTGLMSVESSGLEGYVYPDGEIRWGFHRGGAGTGRPDGLPTSQLTDMTVARLLEGAPGPST